MQRGKNIQKKQQLFLAESVEDKKLIGKARVSAPTQETPDGYLVPAGDASGSS